MIAYIELHPVLMNIVKLTGRESKESVFLLEELAETAMPGAPRKNFRRKFIEDKEAWKKLPPTPDEIGYAYWAG